MHDRATGRQGDRRRAQPGITGVAFGSREFLVRITALAALRGMNRSELIRHLLARELRLTENPNAGAPMRMATP